MNSTTTRIVKRYRKQNSDINGAYQKSVELQEVQRLMSYIEQNAVDSERMPIQPEEVVSVTNQVIQRLVWGADCLDQVVQEVLDNQRFQV
jgi:hypothetical protein